MIKDAPIQSPLESFTSDLSAGLSDTKPILNQDALKADSCMGVADVEIAEAILENRKLLAKLDGND